MFSFNSGQLRGYALDFSSIMHATKQNSKKKTASSVFKVLFFFFFKSESSDCVQRGLDRRERADVERQTGHKPDLFAGKAVKAEVTWKD